MVLNRKQSPNPGKTSKLNRRIPDEEINYVSPQDPMDKYKPGNFRGKRNKVKKNNSSISETIFDALAPLEERQKAFFFEFIKDYNGLRAAIRAGYSEASAHNSASGLLKNINIRQALNEHERDLATRFISTKERVLKEMSLLAYSDLNEYLETDEEGNLSLSDIKKLPPQISRAIKKLSFVRTTRKFLAKDEKEKDVVFTKEKGYIELYDKKAALDQIGVEIGMFKQRRELTGPNGEPLIPQATTIVMDFSGT
jgi:phage terminase small subunit